MSKLSSSELAAETEGKHVPAASERGEHEHGHRSHGGSWVITYSDMVTLLMALFICIITFSDKGAGQAAPRKRDSILYGSGGTGVAGGAQKTATESIVWRELLAQAKPGEAGSENPPLYTDPSRDLTGEVLRLLDGPTVGTLEDSYTMRLPSSLIFTSTGILSESGVRVLGAVANNFRNLPYEISIEVDDTAQLPQGVALAQYLVRQEKFQPGRLAVGIRTVRDPLKPSVWLTFTQRPAGSGS